MTTTGTTTRKQREIEAREQLILDIAARMLLERGYLGMTMDLVADATEYSKGTIYNHFSSKEELLAGLVAHTGMMRQEMFRRAAAFSGRPRERMTAIGAAIDLFVALHPEHFRAEQIVMADSIRHKVSPERQHAFVAAEQGCMEIVGGIVTDALRAGDLTLPDEVAPPALIFGLWTMSYGGHSIIEGKPTLAEMGIPDPHGALRRNQQAVMDGFGWAPLTHEWDYENTRAWVLQEVFPDEARDAGFI
ncbi:MAG: helix-turn-helix domain-containing protein [Planctomycetota bacterium]|nr:helix-turn-helix domain-containing protein [Planctomycetota bacterium]